MATQRRCRARGAASPSRQQRLARCPRQLLAHPSPIRIPAQPLPPSQKTNASVRRAQRAQQVSKWAEREAKKQGNPKEAARREAKNLEELRVMNEHLVLVRRERMRRLYEEEMAGWERELAAKGLAVERLCT